MPTVALSGSMRKHYNGIVALIREFEVNGITVLSPKASKVANPGKPFILLRTDKTNNREKVEQGHLDAIEKADALYVHNPLGYIGESTGYEISWARQAGKPIFTSDKLPKPKNSIYHYHARCRRASVAQVTRYLRGKEKTALPAC